MERIGLVECLYDKGCGGVQAHKPTHDLTHDFALQEAKDIEGVWK